jgi:hypothetical protein
MTIKQQIEEIARIGHNLVDSAMDLEKRAGEEKKSLDTEGNVHTTFWVASMGKDVYSALKSIDSYKATNDE